MAAHPTAFPVWHRDDSGEVDYPYSADNPVYTVVERCFSIFQKMLEHPDLQRAFVTLAESFEEARREAPAWYNMSSKDTTHMEKITQGFFKRIFAQLPMVFVDYTLREPVVLAMHTRRYWAGASDTAFEPSHQCILLNGKRVGYMAGALNRAKIDDTPENREQYNRFLFLFSTVILHEFAHLFITYLGQGLSNTPDEINGGNVDGAPTKKEAGRRLEDLLLGGGMYVYRDPDEGTEGKLTGVYSSAACLTFSEMIAHFVVLNTLLYQEIEFPYRWGGPPERQPLFSIASKHTGQASDFSDPLDDPDVRKMVEQSVRPPHNINFDHLWHPATRS